MTPTLRFVDRLLTGLVGVLLMGGAAWIIGYAVHYRPAREAAGRIDKAAIADLPNASWWQVAEAAAGVALIVVGAWLLLAHLRSSAVRTIPAGLGAVDLTRLADAAAEDLSRHPDVQSAKATTVTVHRKPVVRITVGVTNATPAELVRRLARRCGADIRRAAGNDVQFQLLVKPVPADKARRVLT
jgi:hypothetical protein